MPACLLVRVGMDEWMNVVVNINKFLWWKKFVLRDFVGENYFFGFSINLWRLNNETREKFVDFFKK